MNRKMAAILLTACLAIPAAAAGAAQTEADETLTAAQGSFELVNLKTDGLSDPLGLDDETPAFSWQMQSDKVGAAQVSYEITVANEDGATVWDSGLVESSASNEIAYEGEALTAQTAYTWTVTVTDADGESVTSAPAQFETALMSTDTDVWNGAQWIGYPDLSLDAASCCAFRIYTGVTIPEGSTSASLILGADDFRLESEAFNVDRQSGENYVRAELDISDVTKEGGARINFYRVGYFEGDSEGTPVAVIDDNEDLNALITEANAHETHDLILDLCASEITVTIDGTTLQTKGLTVNELGGDSSYNTFPNLNSIGFAAPAGSSAIFTGYRIENGGDYGTGVLFGQDTGATYAIFDGAEGIEVADDGTITVGGEADVLYRADPSCGGAPMVRTEFETGADLTKARLYVSCQGIYNLYINGTEIGAEQWFNPGCFEYDTYQGYNTFDVTDYLTEGGNAIGAVLGEGWWTGQMTYDAGNSNYFGDRNALMAMLVLEYADGTQETVVTDESWQTSNDGPVRLASFFQGERYDATKEEAVEGWTEAGFAADGWQSAAVIETRAPFASAQMITSTAGTVHVIRTLDSEYLGESLEGSGSYLYDMGENVSGVPQITIPAELAQAGQTVTVRFAEILYPETDEYTEKGIAGMLMTENYRAAMVTDFYVMKDGENVFVPDLTFHGCRYIEITGLSEALPAENVKMLVLSSLDATATYDSSNELANRLFQNVCNSTTSNYISIPTDCPQRNERMGWVGDAQVFALSGSYVADTYDFLDQWMDSVRASSGENGMSKQYVPAFDTYTVGDETITHKGQSFGITWNALIVTIPYNLYMQTGRLAIVEANYDNICAYLDTLSSDPLSYKDADGEKQTEERLTNNTGTLSDHLARVVSDGKLLGETVYYACLNEAAVMAGALGDEERQTQFLALAADVKEAWNEHFIDPETGKTRNLKGELQDTQASYATPLRCGIVSDENLEKFLENYNASIAEPAGEDTDGITITPYTLTTGFNATANLLPALCRYGLTDTAYRLFESTEYASWLYPVTQGATSIWERWNSYTEENAFNGNNSMNSFNHYSLGGVLEWMMAYQAGITFDETAPGYQQFVLQPTAGGDYTDLTASYDSVYGTITSGWTAEDGVLTSFTATVPANTSATLYLPVDELGEVTVEASELPGSEESGFHVEDALTEHNGRTCRVIGLCAGTWTITVGEGGALTIAV